MGFRDCFALRSANLPPYLADKRVPVLRELLKKIFMGESDTNDQEGAMAILVHFRN